MVVFNSFLNYDILGMGNSVKEFQLLYGTLKVTSNPASVEIFIDGKTTGCFSPIVLNNILHGKHWIKGRKLMHSEDSILVNIENDKQTEIILNLEPQYASVSIITNPSGEISINGEVLGLGSFTGTVNPGLSIIEVKKEKYFPEKQSIMFKKGEESLLSFELKPITGNYAIISDPPEAQIYIDGDSVGLTPIVVQGLSIGKHIVVLQKAGFKGYVNKTTIKEYETTKTEVQLLPIDPLTQNVTGSSSNEFAGFFEDKRDKQKYLWVKIGQQIWMAENLNFNSPGSWCYDNSTNNCNEYGRLYTNETANKVCPTGWHLPDEKDWNELATSLGGENKTGGKLKETGTNHWKPPNLESDNLSGFSALPGGMRDSRGSFNKLGTDAFFWTLDIANSSTSFWSRTLSFNFRAIFRDEYDKNDGFSVRCVKDNH